MTPSLGLSNVQSLVEFLAATGPFTIAVWDFDGVIGDTEEVQAASYRRMLGAVGISPADDFFDDLTGRTELEIWTVLKARHNISDGIAALRDKRTALVTPLLVAQVTPNWFVHPALTALRDAGVPSIIVSASTAATVTPCLEAWRIRPMFARVSTSTGMQSDTPKCERLRRTLHGQRALVIEDSSDYLRLAAELGAVTLGVRHQLNSVVPLPADGLLHAT